MSIGAYIHELEIVNWRAGKRERERESKCLKVNQS